MPIPFCFFRSFFAINLGWFGEKNALHLAVDDDALVISVFNDSCTRLETVQYPRGCSADACLLSTQQRVSYGKNGICDDAFTSSICGDVAKTDCTDCGTCGNDIATDTSDQYRAASLTFCVTGFLLFIPDIAASYIRTKLSAADYDATTSKRSLVLLIMVTILILEDVPQCTLQCLFVSELGWGTEPSSKAVTATSLTFSLLSLAWSTYNIARLCRKRKPSKHHVVAAQRGAQVGDGVIAIDGQPIANSNDATMALTLTANPQSCEATLPKMTEINNEGLGVTMVITRETRFEKWGIVFSPPRPDRQILIQEVLKQSVAARSGVYAGGSVIAIDGQPIAKLAGRVTTTMAKSTSLTMTLTLAANPQSCEATLLKMTEINNEGLGVTMVITRETRFEKWGIVFSPPRPDRQILIQEVLKQSVAARSGVYAGGSVIAIDGQPIAKLAGRVTTTMAKSTSLTMTLTLAANPQCRHGGGTNAVDNCVGQLKDGKENDAIKPVPSSLAMCDVSIIDVVPAVASIIVPPDFEDSRLVLTDNIHPIRPKPVHRGKPASTKAVCSGANATHAPTEANTDTPTESAADASTETLAKPAAETSTDTPTEPAAEGSSDTPAEPAVEASTETLVDPAAETSTDAHAEPAAEVNLNIGPAIIDIEGNSANKDMFKIIAETITEAPKAAKKKSKRKGKRSSRHMISLKIADTGGMMLNPLRASMSETST